MMALTPKRLFLSLSLHLYLSSPLLHFLLTLTGLWSLKLSLKMRVSFNELFSTLKKSAAFMFNLTRVHVQTLRARFLFLDG